MASAKVPVTFTPVDAKKVEAALARIQAQAKGVNFGGGAQSINKLSRPLGKITGQASEFQKSLEASNARVLAFGASVAVINKLSEAFGALVANTIKVEASFAKINIILDGSQKQIEQFGNGIFKVAQQTGTSFDQVADGALELARQGLGVEESLSRVETALKLVRVAGIDSQQAVAGLTAAIKGFEGAGLTVTEIADKLAEVDTKFAVSTEDLINGLERASASARVAGVSFDELLGVVTTVQERTQRGGAVIGNAFKTIFARLGRTDTLVALQDLGINVLDAEGNVRGAIPLFQELAVELDKLGLKSVQAGDIIQKVAGVRQRDILISLVEDLNSGQSQFAKSLQVSAGAAGALDAKNEKLNETLEALINNLVVGGQKLASVIGEIGFTDEAGKIIKVFGDVVNYITDVLQGDGLGSKFAEGFLKGLGKTLVPGVALVGAIFAKLFINLAKFGATSLKQILGINKAAQAQATLQQSVFQSLLQNENIQREILALEGNKVAQEKLLLSIYNQQIAALARVQKAAAAVTPGLFGAGLRGGEGGIKGKGGRAAGGYIAAEARDVSRGVGGAPASSKVVSIPNFAFGGGQRGTMVANTSEYIVPNFAGGGDAIFNRDMVRSMGLPAGARKINAAGGYVPNFANRNVGDYGFLVPEMGANRPIKPFDVSIGGKKTTLTGAKVRGIVPGQAEKISDPIEDRIRKSVINESTAYAQQLKPLGRSVSRADIESGFGTIAGAKGALQSAIGAAFEVGITKSLDYKAAIREKGGDFDIRGGTNLPRIRKLFGMPDSMSVADLKVSDSVGNVESFYSKVMKEIGAGKFDEREKKANAKKIAIQQISSKYPQFYTTKGVLKTRGISREDKKRMEALELRTTNKVFNSRFGNAASGYIPNFAGGALEEAIGREQAAGLPISQIRINQSGKLRNAQNPQGLAVTNTRDEPTGAIPNFVSADKALGGLFAAQALSGVISSFVEAGSAADKFSTGLLNGVSMLSTFSLLAPSIASASANLDLYGKKMRRQAAMNFLNQKGTGASLATTGKSALGRAAGIGSKALAFAGPVGMIASILIPLIMELKKPAKEVGEVSKESASQLESFNDSIAGLTDKGKIYEAILQFRDMGRQARDNLNEIKGTKEEVTRYEFETLDTLRGPMTFRIPVKTQETVFTEEEEKQRNIYTETYKNIKTTLAELSKMHKKAGAAAKEAAVAEEKLISQRIASARMAGIFERELLDTQRESMFGETAIRLDSGGLVPTPDSILGKERQLANPFLDQGKRFELGQEIERLKLTEQQTIAAQKQRQEFAKALVAKQETAIFDKEGLANLMASISGNEKISDLQEKIKELVENNAFEAEPALLEQYKQGAETLTKQKDLQNDILEATQATAAAAKEYALSTKFSDGLKKGMFDLKEEVKYFEKNLGQEIPAQFADNLGTAMTQAITGAESIGDALSAAGRNFLGYMVEAFARQAAMSAVSGIGSIFGFSEGGKVPGYANGGMIKGYANGGAIAPSDTVPAMLTPGEFVMSKPAVDKYGPSFMQNLNNGMAEQGGSITNNSQFTFNIEGGRAKDGGGSMPEQGDLEFSRKIRSAVTTIIQEESRKGGSLGYLYK